jgi:hypothetical protein
MAQRKSIHLKIFVGVVVLLACGAYWIYENDSAKASARYPRDVDWSRFSLLNERSSGPQEERKKKKQASVVILFGLSDCETHEEAFNAWTNGTAQYENIDLVGVMSEPSALTAGRYLKLNGQPFPVRLDSTGWFEKQFHVKRMPAILLLAPGRTPRVIPSKSADFRNAEPLLRELDASTEKGEPSATQQKRYTEPPPFAFAQHDTGGA